MVLKDFQRLGQTDSAAEKKCSRYGKVVSRGSWVCKEVLTKAFDCDRQGFMRFGFDLALVVGDQKEGATISWSQAQSAD